jgi:hypothetical protein
MIDKRIHGIEAAGAGDLGPVDADERVGPCPSCGAELSACRALNPATGRVERALTHPVPFCTYFGETDPEEIEGAIEERRS